MKNLTLYTYYFCVVCLAHGHVCRDKLQKDQPAVKEFVNFFITHSESFEISICLTKLNNKTDRHFCFHGNCTSAKSTYSILHLDGSCQAVWRIFLYFSPLYQSLEWEETG